MTSHVLLVPLVAVMTFVACEKAKSSPEKPPAPVPSSSTVTLSSANVTVDGAQVIALHNGDVADTDLDGGHLAFNIPALVEALHATRQRAGAASLAARDCPELAVDVAPTTSYRLLTQVLFSAKQPRAGFVCFSIQMANVAEIPIRLPNSHDRQIPSATPPTAKPEGNLGAAIAIEDGTTVIPPGAPPLQIALSVAAGTVKLWSMSGLEGTLATPKSTWTITAGAVDVTAIHAALLDIARRHYGGKPRDASSYTAVVSADGATTMSTLLPILAAVRCSDPSSKSGCERANAGVAYDADRMALFPDLRLAIGVE